MESVVYPWCCESELQSVIYTPTSLNSQMLLAKGTARCDARSAVAAPVQFTKINWDYVHEKMAIYWLLLDETYILTATCNTNTKRAFRPHQSFPHYRPKSCHLTNMIYKFTLKSSYKTPASECKRKKSVAIKKHDIT